MREGVKSFGVSVVEFSDGRSLDLVLELDWVGRDYGWLVEWVCLFFNLYVFVFEYLGKFLVRENFLLCLFNSFLNLFNLDRF